MSVISRVTLSKPQPILPTVESVGQLNDSLLEGILWNMLKTQPLPRTPAEDGKIFDKVYQFALSGERPFKIWHNILGRNKMIVLAKEKICVYFDDNVFFNFIINQSLSKRCIYSLKQLSTHTKYLIVFHIVQPYYDFLHTKHLKNRSNLRSIQWMCLDSVPLKSLMMSLRTVRSLMADVNTIITCNFPTNRTPQLLFLGVNCCNMGQVTTMMSKLHCHSQFLQLNFPVFVWDDFRDFFDTNVESYDRVTKLTISGEVSYIHEYFVEFIPNLLRMFPKVRYLNFHFRIFNRVVQPLPNYNIEFVVNELNTLSLMVKQVVPEVNLCLKIHRFELFSIPDRRGIIESVNRIENFIRFTTLDPVPDDRCFRMRSEMVIPPVLNELGDLVSGKKLFYIASLFEENPDYPSNVVQLFDPYEYIVDSDPAPTAKKRRHTLSSNN